MSNHLLVMDTYKNCLACSNFRQCRLVKDRHNRELDMNRLVKCMCWECSRYLLVKGNNMIPALGKCSWALHIRCLVLGMDRMGWHMTAWSMVCNKLVRCKCRLVLGNSNLVRRKSDLDKMVNSRLELSIHLVCSMSESCKACSNLVLNTVCSIAAWCNQDWLANSTLVFGTECSMLVLNTECSSKVLCIRRLVKDMSNLVLHMECSKTVRYSHHLELGSYSLEKHSFVVCSNLACSSLG